MLRSKRYDYQTNSHNIVTEYVGSSLFVQTDVVRVMSDVWDDVVRMYSVDDAGRLIPSEIGSHNDYELDGTEEAIERHRAWLEEGHYMRLKNCAEDMAKRPLKGRVVKVVKGRRAVGTVGRVVVAMEASYGMGYRSSTEIKLGIATSSRMVKVVRNGREYENYADMEWVWERNVEVEKPEAVDYNALREQAKRMAESEIISLREKIARSKVQYAAYFNGPHLNLEKAVA